MISPQRVRDGGRPVGRGSADPKSSTKTGAATQRPDRGTRTRRPADPKRIARERRLAQQRRLAILRSFGALALLVVIVLAARTVYLSDVLAVERVVVTGATHLAEAEVREFAAVPTDATLLRFPADEVEERLLAHPWIADVRISREVPDGMIIAIEERVPAALVDVGGAELWVVDGEGRVLESRTPAPEDSFIVIRDLPEFEPVVGEVVENEVLENVLAILDDISEALASSTRAVSAPSVDLTALITTDDVEILFGSAEDIERKDVVARTILVEQAGRVVHINVRTPDRPTWRGIDTDD